MRGFRGRCRLWLAAVLAGVVAALLVSASAGAAGCILLCPTTTTTTPVAPPPTGAPTISTVTVGQLTPTSAVITAEVDPDGLATTVRGIAAPRGQTVPPEGKIVSVPAGETPVRVQTMVTGLLPGSSYAFKAEAANSEGQATAGGVTASLPEAARVPLTLTASRSEVLIGQRLTFTGVAHGTDPYAERGQLQAQALSGGRFTDVGTANADHARFTFSRGYNRNARFRVTDTGRLGRFVVRAASTSNTVTVKVFPRFTGGVTRPVATSPIVVQTAMFTVHPVKGSFVGENVYFYHGVSKAGPLTRYAVVRLRARGFRSGTVGARAQLNDPGTGYFEACVVHQVLPDMGVPFTNTRCGGSTFG